MKCAIKSDSARFCWAAKIKHEPTNHDCCPGLTNRLRSNFHCHKLDYNYMDLINFELCMCGCQLRQTCRLVSHTLRVVAFLLPPRRQRPKFALSPRPSSLSVSIQRRGQGCCYPVCTTFARGYLIVVRDEYKLQQQPPSSTAAAAAAAATPERTARRPTVQQQQHRRLCSRTSP
jgi:hypothetical protein